MAEITREVQRIVEVVLPEDGLTAEPRTPMQLQTDNLVQRVIAWLVAFNGRTLQLLQCTAAGALHVANVGSGLSLYVKFAGSAPNAYDGSNTVLYAASKSKVEVLLETYGATMKFYDQDGNFMDAFDYPPGALTLDLSTRGVAIQNRTSGQVCVYQFLFFS